MSRTARVVCDICGTEAGNFVELNVGHQGFLCRGCGVLSTLVGVDSSIEVNRRTYSDVVSRKRNYLQRRRELNVRFEWIYRRFKLSQFNSILEIGSNLGYFSDFLQRQGHNVCSLEINDECRIAQKELFDIDAVSSLDALVGSQFDLIVSMDVIEHIPGVLGFLNRLSKHVSAGGGIYIQLPNRDSSAARIAGSAWRWWSAPDHLYHFNRPALDGLAARVGLANVEWTTFSPVLDDLTTLPLVGKALSPLWYLNRAVPINHCVEWRGGSLLGAIYSAR